MATTFKDGDRVRITQVIFGDDWPDELHDEFNFLVGAEGTLKTASPEELAEFRAELIELGEDPTEVDEQIGAFAGIVKIDAGVEDSSFIGFEWGVGNEEIELVEVTA